MQKKKYTKLLRQISENRVFFVSLAALILLGLAFTIYSLLVVPSGDAFVWSRYTHFGATHFYRDRWHYFYSWPLFGILVTAIHTTIATQSLRRRKPRLATLVIFSALLILVVSFLVLGRIVALPR